MNGQESKAKRVYLINRLDEAGLKLHVVEADVLRLLQHVQTPTREGVEPMAADFRPHSATERSLGKKFLLFLLPHRHAARRLGKTSATREPQRRVVPSCRITAINSAIYPNDFIKVKAGKELRSSRAYWE